MVVYYDEDNFSIKLYRDCIKGKLVGLMEVIPIDELLEVWADRKTESQTCDTCRYSYITCRFMDKGEPCYYEPKTEPQTEYNEYREKIRMHDPHRDW